MDKELHWEGICVCVLVELPEEEWIRLMALENKRVYNSTSSMERAMQKGQRRLSQQTATPHLVPHYCPCTRFLVDEVEGRKRIFLFDI